MKKIVLFVLLLILISGCSKAPNVEIKTATLQSSQLNEKVIDEDVLNNILAAIKLNTDGYESKIYVDEEEEKVSISYHMTGMMSKWTFADCVYLVTESARTAINENNQSLGSIEIVFSIEKSGEENQVIKWESSDFNNGMLVDTAEKYIKEISIEDLFKKYNYEPM